MSAVKMLRAFVSVGISLLFVISSARAGFDLIGSLDYPSFPFGSVRLADAVFENNLLKFNYMLRSRATKQVVVAQATFNIDSKDFETDPLTFDKTKSADVYAGEHIVVFEDNTVFQSNNATAPTGMVYRNIAEDNLCAFGYEKYEGFAYSFVQSSQPFLATSDGAVRQIGGEGGPKGIACQSLNEDQTFIFATSDRAGFSLIFHKNGSTEQLVSSSSSFQMLSRPTVAVNGDYILYCANNLSTSYCYDNKNSLPFFPKFLNGSVLSLAATVLNSEVVLAGMLLRDTLVILTYDNDRNIVDVAENKGVYSWDVPTSAVATDKFLIVSFSFFEPNSDVMSTRIEVYEKNDKAFVPPTSISCRTSSDRLLSLLSALLLCIVVFM